MKDRKAAGLDEIPTEVWKERKFDDTHLQLYNKVFKQTSIEK